MFYGVSLSYYTCHTFFLLTTHYNNATTTKQNIYTKDLISLYTLCTQHTMYKSKIPFSIHLGILHTDESLVLVFSHLSIFYTRSEVEAPSHHKNYKIHNDIRVKTELKIIINYEKKSEISTMAHS